MLRSMHACTYIIRPLVQRHGPNLKIQLWIPCPTTPWTLVNLDCWQVAYWSLGIPAPVGVSWSLKPLRTTCQQDGRSGQGKLTWICTSTIHEVSELQWIECVNVIVMFRPAFVCPHPTRIKKGVTLTAFTAVNLVPAQKHTGYLQPDAPKKMHAQKKNLHIWMWNKSI